MRSPRSSSIGVLVVALLCQTTRLPRFLLTPLRVLLLMVGVACGGGGSGNNTGTTSPPPTKPPTRQAKWALSWSDEFDGTSINQSDWIVQDGAVNVNAELEYYTPSDVYLDAGSLVLETEQRAIGPRRYTSGEVRTGSLHTVNWGSAVEWRTQPPSGKGIWPANWLVAPQCDGLNGCGIYWPPEIDVLEIRGSTPSINVMTHWWSTWPNEQHETSQYYATTSLADDYHTYRLEWFPDSVVWYIDGVRRAKHVANITPGPMQIVMNTAVGGFFDGNPDQTTLFPQFHRIDYVRVYRDTANTY
jgi:beta-glucanase (GH16 family)